MRKPLEQHKPWPGKTYSFYVVDNEGQVIEGDLPDEEHAWSVIDYYSGQGLEGLHIEVEHKPQVRKGFGRDPDLH